MSDPEGFLTRWSRRKREADEPVPATRPSTSEESVPPAPTDHDVVIESSAAESKATEAKPPEVDLSALPSLESITAATDVRPFLLPGVPAELTRAALRRAWVADPAIRDFVGLAENAWDFTAPDTIPGFGSSLPPDVVRRLIAGMMGEGDTAAPAEADPPAEAVTKPDVSASADANVEASGKLEPPAMDESEGSAEDSTADVAVHKEEAPSEHAPKPGRGHGGALPR